MNVQGTICCRSCGTEQPFTEHTCIQCGLDPWAEPPATSETRSAQSGTGSGGGPGSSGACSEAEAGEAELDGRRQVTQATAVAGVVSSPRSRAGRWLDFNGR